MADDIFQKIKALCGPHDKMVDFKFVDDNDYVAVIRTKRNEHEAEDYSKWCDDWMKKFGSATTTTWIVRYTYPSAQKYIYRKVFKCQHSSFDKVKHRKRTSLRNRDKGCNATVNILIKKINSHTIKNDNYLRNEGLNIVITISFKHNHSVKAAEAYSYLRMLPETEATFWGYFDAGMAPSVAKTYHEMVLKKENGVDDLGLILANGQINPNERQINYLHSKWRLKQDQAAQQGTLEEGQGSSSTVTQEVVTLPTVQVKFEQPDESDEFKQHGLVYFEQFAQNPHGAHDEDPLVLKMDSQEITEALHSIKEDVEFVNEASDVPETSDGDADNDYDWRVTAQDIAETMGDHRIGGALAVKQTIQSRWEQIAGNASEPAETVFVEPLVLDVGRKRRNVASAKPVLKRRPPDVSTSESLDLCVLCAKDMSRIRGKRSVAKFADVIMSLTGIDITQYYTVMPNACSTCYRDASIVNTFKTKVIEASLLLKDILPQNPNVQVETQQFNTQLSEATHLKDPFHNIVKNEPKDPDEMDVTQLETETATPAVTESPPDVSVESDTDRKNENGIDPLTSKLKDRRKRIKTTEMARKTACSVCGKLYNNKNYYNHMRSHKGLTSCKVCGKRVKFSYLRHHKQIHNDKARDKFMCTVCGKSYYNMNSLRLHEVVHGEKKHKCNICNRTFHYLKYLERHMRSHSGEKPYACTMCDKTFSIFWNLQQHRRLHTHSKPYQCRLCPAAFRHNVSLKGHLVSTHTANELAADSASATADESVNNTKNCADSQGGSSEITDNLGNPVSFERDVTNT